MNRLKLLYKLDDLLEVCQSCDKRKLSNASPDVVCKGCDIYAQIREIGENLGGKKKMAVIEMDEYMAVAEQGLSVKKIADRLGVSQQDVSNFKYRNKGLIDTLLNHVQPVTDELKPFPCDCTKEDKTAEKDALISALNDQIFNKDNVIADLKDAIVLYKSEISHVRNQLSEIENLHAACDDTENEVASLQELNKTYLDQLLDTRHDLIKKDYDVENQKGIINHLGKTLERYEAENKALRQLVGLWI